MLTIYTPKMYSASVYKYFDLFMGLMGLVPWLNNKPAAVGLTSWTGGTCRLRLHVYASSATPVQQRSDRLCAQIQAELLFTDRTCSCRKPSAERQVAGVSLSKLGLLVLHAVLAGIPAGVNTTQRSQRQVGSVNLG